MIRHHLYYNRHYRHINFLLLSIILLSMQIALSFAVQHSLAYIQPKGSNISKPLRAWMCSGKSNKQLVDNLAAVSLHIECVVKILCTHDMYIFLCLCKLMCMFCISYTCTMFLLHNVLTYKHL